MKSLSTKINESLSINEEKTMKPGIKSLLEREIKAMKLKSIDAKQVYSACIDAEPEDASDVAERLRSVYPECAKLGNSDLQHFAKNVYDIVINESLNESLKASDLKKNETYFISQGKIEAYAEFVETKGKVHIFDNSGEKIEIQDKDLAKCVTNESLNESVNESKRFTVEVSVKDAKEANEILKDLRHIKYDNHDSNEFVFYNEDDAETAKDAFKKAKLEVKE